MDHGFGDTLGLVSSGYLDDLGYLPPLHFTPRHSTLDTFMFISILLEFDRYFPYFGPRISLWHMTSHLTLWIREGCRSVLDFLSWVFMYLLDFEFNIFHDSRVWQITVFLVTMLSFVTIDMLSFNLLAFCILCNGHLSFYPLVIFLLCQHSLLIHGPVWHSHLRLDIFITWLTSISQSTIVLMTFHILVFSPAHTRAYLFL